MRNKRKWYSILLVGLVLLLASSVSGCAPSPTEQGLQEAYQKGHADGYEAGFTAGLASTPQDVNAAYRDGYNAGLADGIAQCEPVEPDEIQPPNGTDGGNGEEKELPSGAIQWYEAKGHIGDKTTVCGPVAGTKYGATSRGKPTWLNIGNDYPSSERFVVIIWGENRGNFPQPPESYYDGKTICVTGLIQEYKGIPQIEVKTPDQIQEQ